MNPLRILSAKRKAWQANAARRRLASAFAGAPPAVTRADWPQSLENPTVFYLRCTHYFDNALPAEFRRHRQYFSRENRGYGEDAFHAMWFLLFCEFLPGSFLEIGVYRGQTLSLAALLARHFNRDCHIQGISPFSAEGDSVSKYRDGMDYYSDTLKNFTRFQLPAPALLKAYSTDVSAAECVGSHSWNMIYIDGNHDYEIVRQDWDLCARAVLPGGIIVLDDASLDTAYVPPIFATAGHSGPSRLAREISHPPFTEILRVGHNRVFQKNPA